jgi:hypothetical protein
MTAATGTPARDLAADLDHADLLLRCVELLADNLDGMDPADRMQLASSVRTARRAIAFAMTPARQHLSSAATVADGPDRAGKPPLPGAGTFSLPRAKPFEIGVGPLYDVLPGRSS